MRHLRYPSTFRIVTTLAHALILPLTPSFNTPRFERNYIPERRIPEAE